MNLKMLHIESKSLVHFKRMSQTILRIHYICNDYSQCDHSRSGGYCIE